MYEYFMTYNSPIGIASRWVSAIEQKDITTICELTIWNNQPISEDQAKHLLHTLYLYSEWKYKIYEQLQKDAIAIATANTNRNPSWFQITRLPEDIHYRVQIPSIYIDLITDYPVNLVRVNEQVYSMNDQPIGPIMALDSTVEIVYQNDYGEIIESHSLTLPHVWEEETVQIMVSSLFSAYNVWSNYLGGDLFVDHRYVGSIHGNIRIEPLSYEQHVFRLERTLPWGKVQSPIILANADEQDVFLPINYYTEELLRQLGETLSKFNESWNEAVRTSNPMKLKYVHPSLKKVMSDMIRMQSESTRFIGYFVQVLIDPSSIEIKETEYGKFEVRLIAREDYAEGHWVDWDGNELQSYEQQRYWLYTLMYSDDRGWEVADLYAYEEKIHDVRDWVAFHSSKVLRIGVDAGLPPFESIMDGKLYGFDIDFMEWLGEKIGVTILFYEMPWNEIVDKLYPFAEIDGAISAIDVRYAEELDHVLVTKPYYADEYGEYVILLRKDLKTIYEKMNGIIQYLHSVYRFEYNDIKRKHFLSP